jgi:hypothetical protein
VLQVGCVEHEVESGKHGCDVECCCDKAPSSDGRTEGVGDAQEQEQQRHTEAAGYEGEEAAVLPRVGEEAGSGEGVEREEEAGAPEVAGDFVGSAKQRDPDMERSEEQREEGGVEGEEAEEVVVGLVVEAGGSWAVELVGAERECAADAGACVDAVEEGGAGAE